jgi:hypothetical protein
VDETADAMTDSDGTESDADSGPTTRDWTTFDPRVRGKSGRTDKAYYNTGIFISS